MGSTQPRGAALSWDAFLSTYLPALVLGFGTGIAVPALPALAISFGVTFGLASGVVTAFLIGNVIGTIPSGWLIDRFGRRPVLVAGPLITAASAFLVVGTHSFVVILILRFFTGAAAQMWVIARLAAISHDAEAGQRGRLITFLYAMDSTGKLAGPVLGGFIASAWGARSPFIAYGVLALLALVPTVLFAKDTPRRDEVPKEAVPALSLRAMVLPRLVYFGVALSAGLTRGPLIADLLFLYAAFEYHLGPVEIGYLATATIVISWPIGLLAGWMMDRFGRKRTMVPGYGGIGVAMAGLAVTAFLHLPLAWFVTLLLLGAALMGLTSGSIQTMGADVAPPEARGTFLGVWSFVGQCGSTLSPIVFALLADRVNYTSSFLFNAASGALVALLVIRWVPETRLR